MRLVNKGIIFASIMAGTIMTSCSYKTIDYSTRTVSVHGTGSVSVDADNATITMSVVTRGINVAAAANQNAEITTNVRKSITALGIAKENVTTQNFTVFQETNYENGKSVIGDYRITNQIQIFVKDVDRVSEIIDIALESGANQLSSLQYGISDNELAIRQARTIAVQQAQEAAQLIAGTSGARLGKVLRIEEQQNFSNARNVTLKAMAAMDDASFKTESTPISSGKSTISVSVDAIYELK